MRMSFALALGWAIGVAFLLRLLVEATVAIRPGAGTDIVNLGACQALAFVVGTFAVLRLHAADLSSRQSLALRPSQPILIVLGLALGFATHIPAESLRVLVEHQFPTPIEVLAARAALLTADSPLRVAVVLFFVACVGPLVEEIFFRGALFGALRRSHTLIGSAVVCAIAFVLGHADPRMWLPLLVVSAVLTHLRAASGSLLPGLALHVGFNTVGVLGHVTGVAAVGKPLALGALATSAGWIATGALVFAVQYVSAKSDEAERARAEDEEE